MLHRIALTLFLACLALPAMAMPLCHPAPQQHAAMAGMAMTGMDHAAPAHGDGDPHRDQGGDAGSAMHNCIGCIARPAPMAIVPPPLPPEAAAVPRPAARMDGATAPPSTPPPRA